MYAIVRAGGRQYKIQEKDEVIIDRMNAEPGSKIELKDVLFIKEDGKHLAGKAVSQAKVKAVVVEQLRGEKVVVLKYRPKKGYRKQGGERALQTRIRIESIDFPGKKKETSKNKGQAKGQAARKSKTQDKKTKASSRVEKAEDKPKSKPKKVKKLKS